MFEGVYGISMQLSCVPGGVRLFRGAIAPVVRGSIGNIIDSLIAILIIVGVVWLFLGIVLPIILHGRAAQEGKKSKGCAYLLLLFWPPLALHRFYAGKAGTAILWIFTGGFLGIGFLIDLFLTSSMIDEYNRNAETQNMMRETNRMMQQNLQMQQNMMIGAANPPYAPTPKAAYQQQPAYQPPVQPQGRIVLAAVAGEYAGNTIEIPPEGLIIGRDPSSANLIIPAGDISRKHCLIISTGAGLTVTDYSSVGTFIDGSKLPGGVPYSLQAGQRLYLGSKSQVFEVRQA